MPSPLMPRDQREHLLDQQRREAERGLVEDQQLRLGHQAAPDGQHLLLAARQRAGALRHAARAGAGRCANTRSQIAARLRPAAAIAAEIEIFAHAHVREDAAAFRHMDQAARRRSPAGVAPVDALRRRSGSSPAPRPQHAGDRAVERRLAGAVGAEHGDDLARADREVDAAQDLGRAIAGAQARTSSSGSAMRARAAARAAPWPR